MSNYIGILRSPRFSPGKVEHDAAILHLVAEELRHRNHQVLVLSESDFQIQYRDRLDSVCVDALFGMYREEATLEMIERLEHHYHIRCINSAQGVRSCTHVAQIHLLRQAGVLIPPTVIVTDACQLDHLIYPCWLKKGTGWSLTADDVQCVENATQAYALLPRFQTTDGQLCIVASAHIEGRHCKFYRPCNGRFGPLLPVYGGDAVTTPDGCTYVIDINDWPSFATCRDTAAPAIAEYIVNC